MLWQLYLRYGTVFVPTVARTVAGYYMNIDPVEVVSASDVEAVQTAIRAAMNSGNPTIPTPTRAESPKPVELKYAKVRSWSKFEKAALIWSIIEKDSNFKIVPGRRRRDRGWEEDHERTEHLPPGATPEMVARRMAVIVQAALEDQKR
jgi:hypothetical protein